jgi:hypothetical protein
LIESLQEKRLSGFCPALHVLVARGLLRTLPGQVRASQAGFRGNGSPMITLGAPVTREEMLLDWALAEAADLADNGWIPRGLAERVTARAPLTPEENAALIQGILGRRGPFLGALLNPSVSWYAGSASCDAIGSIGLCRWLLGGHKQTGDGTVRHYRTLGELADGDPGLGLKTPFDPAALRGHPILVSEREAGPWCLVEGTHRLADEFRRTGRSGPHVGARDVILGISPLAPTWHWWVEPPSTQGSKT